MEIVKAFEKIGATAKVRKENTRRNGRFVRDAIEDKSAVLNILKDNKKKSYFDLLLGYDAELIALDVNPELRHLVVMVKNKEKSKFLCGHDERDWFVAAIPEFTPVTTVESAMEALKPKEIRTSQKSKKVKNKHINKRKNASYVRQGEWFFVPVKDFSVDENLIIHNEPLVRSRVGNPHMASQLYRTGGETVQVHRKYPNGLVETEWKKLPKTEREMAGWTYQKRNMEVYVRGAIRHADHKTVTLGEWHKVVENTERKSRAMRFVAFID